MSRIAFISDIHGNYPALTAVLNDIDTKQVDSIYCLGDLVGYYSQINEVIDTVRLRNISCILGNHDYALIHNKGVIPRSRTCTNVLTKQLEYISSQNHLFLKSLPDSLIIEEDKYKILAVHGGINDYIDEYIQEITESYFSSLDSTISYVISAHNHKANIQNFSKVHYANTGSVGQPRDHDPRASYLLYDNGSLEIIRVSYDIEAIIRQMESDGFPSYISEVLKTGSRIGEKDA